MSKRPASWEIKSTKCCRFHPKTREPRDPAHPDNDPWCIFAHPIDGEIWERGSVNPKMEEIHSKRDGSSRDRQPSWDYSRRHRSPPVKRGRSRSPDRGWGGRQSRRSSDAVSTSHAANSPPSTWGSDPPSRRVSRSESSTHANSTRSYGAPYLPPAKAPETSADASMWGASSPTNMYIPASTSAADGWGAASPVYGDFKLGTDAPSASSVQPTVSAAPTVPSTAPAPINSSTKPMEWEPTGDDQRRNTYLAPIPSETHAELSGAGPSTSTAKDVPKPPPSTAATSDSVGWDNSGGPGNSSPPVPPIPRTQSPVAMDMDTEKGKGASLFDGPAPPAPNSTHPSSAHVAGTRAGQDSQMDVDGPPALPLSAAELSRRKEEIKERVKVLQSLIEAKTTHRNLLEGIKQHESQLVLMKGAQLVEGRKILSGMEDECEKTSQHSQALLDKLFNLGDRDWPFSLGLEPRSPPDDGKSEAMVVSPIGLREIVKGATRDLEMIKKRQLALLSGSAVARDTTGAAANTSGSSTPPPSSKKRKFEEIAIPSSSGVAPTNSKDKVRIRRLFKDFEEVQESVRNAENSVNEWSEDLYRAMDERIKQLDKIKTKADAKQKEREEERLGAVQELERARAEESEKVAHALKTAEGLDDSFGELEMQNTEYLARLDVLQTQHTSMLHSLRALTQSSYSAQSLPVSANPLIPQVIAQLKDDVAQATYAEYSQLLTQRSREITERVQAQQETMLNDALDKLRPTLQLQEMVQAFIRQQQHIAHAQGMSTNGISSDMHL